MSTLSLPSYAEPQQAQTPLYTVEPDADERRLALMARSKTRPNGQFVKVSKSAGIGIKLIGQVEGISLPVYGLGEGVEGTVELSKTEGVTSVEIKIDGKLKLKEIAEGGTTSTKLCLDAALLWVKDGTGNRSGGQCPSSLPFRLYLPTSFSFEGDNYSLPPTHEVHMNGLPGFQATVVYTITATAIKHAAATIKAPTKIFGIDIGGNVNPSVTTQFEYKPRSRPAAALPIPLQVGKRGLIDDPDWKVYQDVMKSRVRGLADVRVSLYLPSTRIFCMRESIPFHLVLESSNEGLANIMVFGPGASLKQASRIKVMRQSVVDVRNETILGTKTDIWRVDCIGEGGFQRMGDGPEFIAFSGEIPIQSDVQVPGFKAAGLTIKDWVLLAITPPDAATKAPFTDLRISVPIRLTTDRWMPDGTGIDANGVRVAPHSNNASGMLATDGHGANGNGTNGNGAHGHEGDFVDMQTEYSVPSTPSPEDSDKESLNRLNYANGV